MNFLNKIFDIGRNRQDLPDLKQKTVLNRCFGKEKILSALLGLSLFAPLPSLALTTIERDQMIEQDLQQGQAVWLGEGQERFFTIFTPDLSGEPKGGVILLHDADSQPNKPEVMQPLRNQLPLHGWATIAIQLPHLKQISDYREQQETINTRINKTVDYMQQNGLNNLILLGHGSGAMAASAYLSGEPSDAIRGFVAISLGILPDRDTPDSIPKLIQKISLPILDIYGSEDLDMVTTTAHDRALAARDSSNMATRQQRLEPYMRSGQAMSSVQKQQGYIAYRQMRIEGASHDFRDMGDILAKRVAGWLERHAKGVKINK